MSIVKVKTLPKCCFCKSDAKYDAPTKHGGSWGYMCEDCAKKNMKPGWMESPSLTTFKLHVSPKAVDKTVKGIELNDIETAMMDQREIGCPECDDVRVVEPDANYTYKCEGCGVEVKCPPSLC